MLRKCKYFLLSFIFFISSFLPCFYSYAQGEVWTNSQKTQFFAEGFYKIVTDICGLILPTGLGGQNLQADYNTYVLNNDWIQNNMSYDDWIASQISGAYINGNSGNADVTFSVDLQNSLKEWSKNYIDTNLGYVYGYSANASSYLSLFDNQEEYHAFLDFVSSNNDKLMIINNNPNNIIVADFDYGIVKYLYNLSLDSYQCQLYNGWNLAKYNQVHWWSLNYQTKQYEETIVNAGSSMTEKFYLSAEPSSVVNRSEWRVVNQNISQYIIYNSLNALKDASEGVQDYYITDSYNNTQVSETYTTTTNNIDNSITYGDVQNYVNNYYVENNSYPTTNIVYQYITNYVPSNNGGDNGNDNGGGNSSNIFDFLGTIGDFLGNLIEGIGNVLSGILSAITDVIDMFIGDNGLPNVIGQLISYFLPFLPDWIPTVIGLSVMLALLIGIVKLIRGS